MFFLNAVDDFSKVSDISLDYVFIFVLVTLWLDLAILFSLRNIVCLYLFACFC